MSTHSISIYVNAKHWIAQYESVDEVKDYIDKAAACQEYAKRANDYEMEHQAARARVRAERRCGELLQDMEKAKGNQHINSATCHEGREQTIPEMGLTHKQSSKWQQLANVPEDEFEDALSETSAIPSAHAILGARKPKEEPKRINEKCLYLWGRLIAIEKNLLGHDINYLLDEMTPAMRKDAERIIPLTINWLMEKTQCN